MQEITEKRAKRTQLEVNPPHVVPHRLTRVAGAMPRWRAPPPAWLATSSIRVTPRGVHLRRLKQCWFDPMARTCSHKDHGLPTRDKMVLRHVSYRKLTLGDHLDRPEQRRLTRGGARRRSLAPTKGVASATPF